MGGKITISKAQGDESYVRRKESEMEMPDVVYLRKTGHESGPENTDTGDPLAVESVRADEYKAVRQEREELATVARDLHELVVACFEWIDAVPEDTELPGMPGFPRDWAEDILENAREAQRRSDRSNTINREAEGEEA